MKRSADPNSDKLKLEFRQKLERYQAAPSENLWDKIELSLDKADAKVYKNRLRVYSWLAAACLALLLTFAGVFALRQWEQTATQAPGLAVKTQPETKAPLQVAAVPEQASRRPASAQPAGSEQHLTETPAALARSRKTLESTPATAQVQAPADRRDLIPEPQSRQLSRSGLLAVTTPAKVPATTSETKLPESTTATTAGAPNAPALAANSNAMARKQNSAGNQTSGSDALPLAAAGSARQPAVSASPAARSGIAKAEQTASTVATENQVASRTVNSIANLQETTQQPEITQGTKTETLLAVAPQKPENDLAEPKTVASELLAQKVNATATEPEEKETAAKPARWVVSGSYAALHFESGIKLAGRAFEAKSSSITSSPGYQQNVTNYQEAVREYNQSTGGAYSQKGGVLVGFKLAKNWVVQTGLSYLQNREQTYSSYIFTRNPNQYGPGPNAMTATPEPETAFQVVLTDSFDPKNTTVTPTSNLTAEYRYDFVSLPLNLRFQADRPELYYFAGAGASLNWLTEAAFSLEDQPYLTAYATPANTKTEATQPDVFRQQLWAVELQAGLGYHVSPKWSVELALNGSQFLKPLIREEAATHTVQENARNLGASFNLGYTF